MDHEVEVRKNVATNGRLLLAMLFVYGLMTGGAGLLISGLAIASLAASWVSETALLMELPARLFSVSYLLAVVLASLALVGAFAHGIVTTF